MHISAPGSWRCSERIRHHFRPRKWRLLREKSQMRTWTKHLFSRDAKPIPAPSASASILPLKTCHLTFARRLLTAKPTLQADYLLAPSSSAGCEPNYCTPPCRVSIAAHRLQAWPPHTRQDADSEVWIEQWAARFSFSDTLLHPLHSLLAFWPKLRTNWLTHEMMHLRLFLNVAALLLDDQQSFAALQIIQQRFQVDLARLGIVSGFSGPDDTAQS